MNAYAYLNAASAARSSDSVYAAMADYMQKELMIGPHRAAETAQFRLQEAREAAALLLGAVSPRHIAFGETATRLWSDAFRALPMRQGARILVARCEWGANVITALREAARWGAKIEAAPSGADGAIDVERLANLIDDDVVAICAPMVSSGLGVMQPIDRIGHLPRPDHCLFFIDAAQAAGRAPCNLTMHNGDVITAPARKWLRGPKGQSVMALSDRALQTLGAPPSLDLASCRFNAPDRWIHSESADRFESFDFSVCNRLGFGEALQQAARNLSDVQKEIDRKLARLATGLATMPWIRLYESIDRKPAFLTFRVADETPEATTARLHAARLMTGIVRQDYAYRELAERGETSVCRVSPHIDVSDQEIDRLLSVLADGSGGAASDVAARPASGGRPVGA